MSDNDSPRSNANTQSGLRAIRDIVLVAIVLGAGFFWYYTKTTNEKLANATAIEARDLLLKDNPQDYEAAAAKLAEVLEKYDPQHGYSLAALAELNAILWGENHLESRKADALKFAAQAMAANPAIAEQYSAQALVTTFDGKAEEAERFLADSVLEKGGGGARIFAALGQAQRAQGKLVESRRAFKAAIDSDWRNARFAQLIGESYLEEGDTANAVAYFERGLAANSEHYGCRLGLARARLQRGEQVKESAEVIEKILGESANLTPALHAMALVAQAELRLLEQKVDEAIASASQAAEKDPAYAWAYAVKARAEANKGPENVSAAIADFDKAIAADPYVAAFHFDAAVTLASGGEADKAVEYLEKYPLKKDDRFHLKYGHVLRALDRLDAALVQYEEARKLNETNAEIYLSKGVVLIAQNKLDEARAELDMALRAQEFNPPVHVQIAQIHFAKKEWEEGLQTYARALEQWKRQRVPREQLAASIAEVKQLLLKAGQRQYAQIWEEEATAMVR